MAGTASHSIERIARLSYGKLVALLAVRTRNIAAAEDALSGALVRALEQWPQSGVPQNPEAWLLTAARRIDIDQWRRALTARNGEAHLGLMEDERMTADAAGIPDERLRLMFACTHPVIDAGVRTPLMLQVVLGLSVQRMASAFLVPPATLGQRLARAKARIRDSGIRLEMPGAEDAQVRAGAVLDAAYAAYTLGADAAFTADEQLSGLAVEAMWLARLIVQLLPGEAEARGLLALMLLAEARRAARRAAPDGRFVPLSEQDVRLWDNGMMDEAEHLLRAGSGSAEPGRFGLEAAIQSVHAARRRSGTTDWAAIAHLYAGLVRVSPTVGALVGQAVALSHLHGAAHRLGGLDALPTDRTARYPAYWAARAHLEAEAGRREAAAASYHVAIGLTEDAAVRRFLTEKRGTLFDS